jgi:hypothetical protein
MTCIGMFSSVQFSSVRSDGGEAKGLHSFIYRSRCRIVHCFTHLHWANQPPAGIKHRTLVDRKDPTLIGRPFPGQIHHRR